MALEYEAGMLHGDKDFAITSHGWR